MKRILLAEDDPLLIDIYTKKFKKAGFDVKVAETGAKVIETLQEAGFDILVLDIVLPELGGWEVLRKIKSDPKFAGLKIIILSNLGQKTEVEKGMALGATKYLIKAHYTPSQVVEEIEKIFQ